MIHASIHYVVQTRGEHKNSYCSYKSRESQQLMLKIYHTKNENTNYKYCRLYTTQLYNFKVFIIYNYKPGKLIVFLLCLILE